MLNTQSYSITGGELRPTTAWIGLGRTGLDLVMPQIGLFCTGLDMVSSHTMSNPMQKTSAQVSTGLDMVCPLTIPNAVQNSPIRGITRSNPVWPSPIHAVVGRSSPSVLRAFITMMAEKYNVFLPLFH